MTNQTHEGYTNYATWNVCLWIDNDQVMYSKKVEDCKLLVEKTGLGVTPSVAEALAELLLGGKSTPDLDTPYTDEEGIFWPGHEGHRWEDINWNEVAEEWTNEAREALEYESN